MSDHSGAQAMWEERFSVDDYVYGTEPNGFLRENESILPMGEVLCLAEGEGRNAVFLAKTGRLVSSVDLTKAGVAKTLHLAVARGVVIDAVVGDLASYDLGVNRWDAIVSIFAHMPSSTSTAVSWRRSGPEVSSCWRRIRRIRSVGALADRRQLT